MALLADAIIRYARREIIITWGHARFGFSVKIFLTEKEK